DIYTKFLIPALCEPGDDSNYGSTATRDIECLQALSRRIHYGKFVAESKFQDQKYNSKYIELIKAGDRNGILETLTNKQVEQKLLDRLRLKVTVYGQDLSKKDVDLHGGVCSNDSATKPKAVPDNLRVDTSLVVDLYEKYIIPLTKEVEVEYLLCRLDGPDTPKFVHQ
ncbi:chorismate mutase aro7, partial [Spiromyces aspiralis]